KTPQGANRAGLNRTTGAAYSTSLSLSSGVAALNALRVAMCSGGGSSPYLGGCSVFSMLLYTMNTFERGHGEMLLLEPCMVLQSKNTTEPAFAVIVRMPPCSTSSCRLTGSGTPYSCFFSDCL